MKPRGRTSAARARRAESMLSRPGPVRSGAGAVVFAPDFSAEASQSRSEAVAARAARRRGGAAPEVGFTRNQLGLSRKGPDLPGGTRPGGREPGEEEALAFEGLGVSPWLLLRSRIVPPAGEVGLGNLAA
jgi:hypothetical protein